MPIDKKIDDVSDSSGENQKKGQAPLQLHEIHFLGAGCEVDWPHPMESTSSV
jgi:hypothetical protein